MQDVLSLHMNQDHVIVSGHAWDEYHCNIPQASFQDFWLYCCQALDRSSYILGCYFDQCDRYALAAMDDASPSSPMCSIIPGLTWQG